MYLPLLLFISFPILFAMESKIWFKSWLTNEDYDKKLTKSLFKKDDYKRIESFANDEFKQRDGCAWPPERCPCGNFKLDEMKLDYFQWENPETHKMELARYLINERLFGNGGVGKIIHATMISYPENKPHKCVAIKMAKENFENVKERKASINREIEVIKYFRGAKHIIGYGPRHYYMRNEKEPTNAIIMEIGQSFILNYWSKTEMKDHYSEELILKILKQILIGIDEIHQKNVIHLDLKTANIVKMPSEDGIYLKLIDFGSAIKLENGKMTTNVDHALIITPEFTAPEIIVPKFVENRHKNIMIHKKADIWSFGMIILDLLSYTTEIESLIEREDNPKDFFKLDAANNLIKNKKLKEGEKLNKKFEEELDNFLAISKTDFPRVSAILENCLKWEQNERPTARELLREKHFKNIFLVYEETKNNSDFFGDITKYLDEQFKKISLIAELGNGQLFHETPGREDELRRQKERMKQLIKQQSEKYREIDSDEMSFKSAKSNESFKSSDSRELSSKNEGKNVKEQQTAGQTSKYGIHKNASPDSEVSSVHQIMAINSLDSSSQHSAKHFSNFLTPNKIVGSHSFENLPIKQNPSKFSVRHKSDIYQVEQENLPDNLTFLKGNIPLGSRKEILSSSSPNKSKYEKEIESVKSFAKNKSVNGTGIKLSSKEPTSTVHSFKGGIDGREIYGPFIKCVKKGVNIALNCSLGPTNYVQELNRKGKNKIPKN